MSCAEFENVIVEMARGMQDDAAVLQHAESCGRCRERLSVEKRLTAELAVMAREDAGREAPVETGQVLLAAFRGHHGHARASWKKRAAAGLVAASVIAVVAALSIRRHETVPEIRPVPKVAARQPAPPVMATNDQPVRKIAAQKRPRVQRKTRPRPASIRPPDREVMTDFIPVVYDPAPILRGRLVRVRLPRAALATFGLPMNEQYAQESIKADVLLGDDGLARAVRFVK